MPNLIGGFTVEEYVRSTGWLLFEIRSSLSACVAFGEFAQKELDPSHPAFEHVAIALKSAETGYAALKKFDGEFYRRKQEAEDLGTDISREKS